MYQNDAIFRTAKILYLQHDMSDDILHQMRTRTSNPDLQLSEEIQNEALIHIN